VAEKAPDPVQSVANVKPPVQMSRPVEITKSQLPLRSKEKVVVVVQPPPARMAATPTPRLAATPTPRLAATPTSRMPATAAAAPPPVTEQRHQPDAAAPAAEREIVAQAKPAPTVDAPKAPEAGGLALAPVRTTSLASILAPTPAPPVQFQPPEVLRQPSPVALPPDLRRLLRNEVVLQLRVAVDRNGVVRDVIPVSGGAGQAEGALLRTYTAAVKSWVFEPAKRNGQATDGETVLSFRVSPRR